MTLDPKKIHNVNFLLSAASAKQFPEPTLPEIAFVGRSNVGKSSLINTLLARKNLARTSNTPGKTRLLNFFDIEEQLRFVDLPGYGFARVSKSERAQWIQLINDYLQQRENLCGLVQLLDIRHDPTKEDQEMWEWAGEARVPVVWALTKADKLSGNKRRNAVEKIRKRMGHPNTELLIPFSAETRMGTEEVWQAILELVHACRSEPDLTDPAEDMPHQRE
jgi:GTP-binding protein